MIERVEKRHSFIHQAASSSEPNVGHLAVLAMPACTFVLAPSDQYREHDSAIHEAIAWGASHEAFRHITLKL